MWAPVVNNVVAIVGFGVFIAVFGRVGHLGGHRRLDVDRRADRAAGRRRDPRRRRPGRRALPGPAPRGGPLPPALGAARIGPRAPPGAWRRGRSLGLAVGQLGYLVVLPGRRRPHRTRPSPTGCAASAVAGPGAYSVAFLIFMLPHSLVTVSLATALFTRLSGQAHDADVAGVRATLSSGLRVVGVFTVFATAAIVVLALPLTRVVLATATAGSADAVATVVITMILGLPAFGAWSMFQRAYYAYEDARSMVPIQVVMAAVVVVGAWAAQLLLRPTLWVAGVGAAMTVSYVVGAGIAQWRLRRRLGGIDGARVLQVIARATLAAVVSAAARVRCAAAAAALAVHRSRGVDHPVRRRRYRDGPRRTRRILRLLRVQELDNLLLPLLRRLRGGRR